MGTIYTPIILNGNILMSGDSVWGWATGTTGYVSQYQTVYNSFTTKPEAAFATAQNTMVAALDASGYWSKMDLFYVLANNASDNALINWKNPGTYNLTNTGITQFDAYQGFTGNPSTKDQYLSTNYNVSTNSVNISAINAAFGIYIINNPAYVGALSAYGTRDAVTGSRIQFVPKSSIGNTTSSITGSSTDVASFANTDTKGFYITSRDTSSNLRLYKNGTFKDNFTTVIGSPEDQLPNSTMRLFTVHNLSASTGAYQESLFFVMSSVSDADVSTLNIIVETYMDAIGAGIQ